MVPVHKILQNLDMFATVWQNIDGVDIYVMRLIDSVLINLKCNALVVNN